MILEEQVVVIECRNKNERYNIVSLFQENGFIQKHPVLLGACYIAAYKNTKCFRTFNKNVAHGSNILYTHKQFMEKYAMSDLKKKIEEAKKVTGLSASALSEKLGFQHKYLTNAVREASTQRQKEIIAKLDGLIFKEKNELTHDFEGKALNVNIDDAVMVSKAEYEGLKKELDHKNQVLDKRNDLYQKLELECKDKDEAIKQGLENVADKILSINNLESQLKATQEKFIDVVDQKDKDISKINGQKFFAEEQLREKKKQIYKLERKMNSQALVYWIIILTISIASIVGFASWQTIASYVTNLQCF